MGKVKIIGHSLFCTCFYAHGKVLQAVPGRGSHPGLFSMGLAIMRAHFDLSSHSVVCTLLTNTVCCRRLSAPTRYLCACHPYYIRHWGTLCLSPALGSRVSSLSLSLSSLLVRRVSLVRLRAAWAGSQHAGGSRHVSRPARTGVSSHWRLISSRLISLAHQSSPSVITICCAAGRTCAAAPTCWVG